MEIFRLIKTGAENGVSLWFFTVLPTLLPFMIMSGLMYGCGLDKYIKKILHPVVGRIFGVSPDSTFVLFMGLAAGVPLGASLTAGLVSQKRISRDEGQYLLTLSNNLSIPFIVSYSCQGCLKDDSLAVPVLLSMYIGIIFSAFIIYKPHKKRFVTNNPPGIQAAGVPFRLRSLLTPLDNAIMSGFSTITRVGGYIIIFSIMSELLQNIFSLVSVFSAEGISGTIHAALPAMLSSLFEITSGMSLLGNTGAAALPLISVFFLTFGGLCAAAQTNCVLGGSSLSIKKYMRTRLLAAVAASVTYALLSLI